MIQARLDLEPKDAVAFFTAKGDQLAWDHTEVLGEVNVHAFTVAKVTSLELLRTIRAEAAKSIGPGQGFEQFKKTLRPRLEEMGWWGKQEVLDIDTGEITQVQLGSVRRLRTIYQTNVQTSYMAGRYKRYAANAADRPYWRYVAIMDGRTRPAHAALNGKVFRWDDPIWKVIWPPNGWGCRCRVIALTQAEFDALGLPLEDGTDMIFESEVPINRDGDMVTVKGVRYTDAAGKQRVFRPDPGWDYNPGEAWARFDRSGDIPDCSWGASADFAEGDGKTCMAGIPGQMLWKDRNRLSVADVPAEHRLPTPVRLDRAPDRATALAMISSVLGVSERSPLRVIKTPVGDVALRYEWLAHMVEDEKSAREQFIHFILPTLQSPYEVWLSQYKDGPRHRYIGLFEDAGYLAIVRINRDGSILWNTMRANPKYLDAQRSGQLLYWK